MLIEINPDHPEPRKIRRAVDALGCRLYPNLFGAEILLKASKR